MLTTILEVAGLALIVGAAWVFAGLALALVVAGACCLFTSWRISR